MRIIQLPEANGIQSSDVFAININGVDYKVPVSLFVSAMQAIGSYLTTGDVANNLTTTAAGKVLDARQGKTLNTAKLDKANVYNGLDNTAEGFALDARQGKALNDAVTAITCLVVNCGTISSLPKTVSDSNITADMVVLNSTLGTPSAQTGDWTVTTSAGSLTVSGSISGSTTLTLYLAKSR